MKGDTVIVGDKLAVIIDDSLKMLEFRYIKPYHYYGGLLIGGRDWSNRFFSCRQVLVEISLGIYV